MMALMAFAAAWVANGQPVSILSAEWFVSFSMCGLAYLKLRDVESFSTMFLNYDLLASTSVNLNARASVGTATCRSALFR